MTAAGQTERPIDPETLLIYLRGCVSRTDDEGMISVPAGYVAGAISILTELQHRRAEWAGGKPVAWAEGRSFSEFASPETNYRAVHLYKEDTAFPAIEGRRVPLYAASPSYPASGVRVKALADVTQKLVDYLATELEGDDPSMHPISGDLDEARRLLSALGEHP